MRPELIKKYIQSLHKAIEAGNESVIMEQVKKLHPADIAQVLDQLDFEDAKRIYHKLEEEIAADVLPELEEDLREKILSTLSSREIADRFIDNMPSDDAADVIAELPEQVQDEVLSHMENPEQASDIVDLLKYHEDTAGGLMATELVRINVNRNVLECVREMRKQAEKIDNIYTVYVVDDQEKLVGLLSLKKLLTTPMREKVRDVCNRDFTAVRTDTSSEEVASIMDKYDLVVLPVVDHLGRLMGRITIDDVVDMIREEDTEDVQKMAGIQAMDEPYMSISFPKMIQKRVGWLIILFLGETLTASAMSFFEDQISKAVVLTLFVPLIISSGGNSGAQASTLIIRALALSEITINDWWKIIRRELLVGLTMGIILGIIGFTRIAIWSKFVPVYGDHWMLIGMVIGSSLVGVVLWGTLMGSLFPLALKRAGLDPAVSSAPFVATLVDVTGLIIYFTFAIYFLKGVLL